MTSRLITGTVCILLSLTPTAGAQRLESLKVLQEDYPRVFFFRRSEEMAARKDVSYDQWEKTFEQLMGIEGKVLEEGLPGPWERNIDFFRRFKKRHPNQVVLIHFFGDARDPRFESDRFFAGHWLYFNGTKILSDVPAEEGETDIRVDNPSLFKINMGRYGDSNEDIGLCILDTDGKPNWHESEQVQLVSIDDKQGIIRVRRGCYGTKPHAFAGGGSYAAAHMTEGPWYGLGDYLKKKRSRRSVLLWYYNYSTRCPRDAKGRTCADVLAEHLTELFGPHGALAAFDGLQFDVLWHTVGGGMEMDTVLRMVDGIRLREADCDADGKADNGIFDGVNTYGAGVIEFCRTLRERLGDDRIIQADGGLPTHQRAFGILNGIESECWPIAGDEQVCDWSGGLNRHFFWDQNARPPVFNYINHRLAPPPRVPFSIHRLVFAAGVFTNSAISLYTYPGPSTDPDESLGICIWDEFRGGTENRLGWLGRPIGLAVRMALRQPDLLQGKGKPVAPDLLKRFDGAGARFAIKGGGLEVAAVDPKASELRFRLRDVPREGPDLFVSLTVRAEPMNGYPREAARLMWVRITPYEGRTITRRIPWLAEDFVSQVGKRFMTWVNAKDFTSGFYFPEVKSPTVNLEFVIEGGEPVWISDISVHAHADAIYREFEHGLVLANPSPRPYVFDLEKLFPGRKLRRLKATPNQDTKNNDGSPVAGRLTLQPQDGLFLIEM